MCLLMMDNKPKHIKRFCPYKSAKAGSRLRRNLLRVTPEEDEAEAVKLCRQATAGRSMIRKSLRRQANRAQLADLGQVLEVWGRTRTEESACVESPAAACMRRHLPGAMAPENTTQYLMSNVYADMTTGAREAAASHSTSTNAYGDALSPRSVYAALDSEQNYERHLAYQQQQFEEEYGLCR